MPNQSSLVNQLHSLAFLLNEVFKQVDGSLDTKTRQDLLNFAKLLEEAKYSLNANQPLSSNLQADLNFLHTRLQDIIRTNEGQKRRQKSRFITRPERLSNIFEELFRGQRAVTVPTLQILKIRKAWLEINPNILHNVRIVGFRMGKLFLQASSHAEITFISMEKLRMIERLNQYFIKPIIKDFVFVTHNAQRLGLAKNKKDSN